MPYEAYLPTCNEIFFLTKNRFGCIDRLCNMISIASSSLLGILELTDDENPSSLHKAVAISPEYHKKLNFFYVHLFMVILIFKHFICLVDFANLYQLGLKVS